MKILKLIVLSCLLLLNSYADYIDVPFMDVVGLLSHAAGKNVVVADNVEKNMNLFLPNYDFNNKNTNSKLLIKILEDNGLSVKKINNIYYVSKRLEDKQPIQSPNLHDFIIPYKYLTKKDLISFLSSIFPDVRYTILKNRIILTSTKDQYKKIKEIISKLDSSYLTANISIAVVSTQNQKLRKLGTDLHFEKLFPNIQTYLNIISSDVSFSSSVEDPVNFFLFINALSKKGYTNVVANPTITLVDHQDSLLESTTTLPFLVSTTTTQEAKTQVQTSYEYKDVGVKLYFKNVVIAKDYISFDLDIYVQSVLDKSLTPIVSNKHLKTRITMHKNKLIVIGGINSSETYTTTKNIPLIEYVPVINKFTEFKSTEKNDYTFTISLYWSEAK